ncbi:unnamed protein product [Soboliphyme baturini]|uniref:X-box-binding protein 1 n=1 Tax=Soboliphyme baturini TaxID=241478 RepID=A0A183IU14_9BILA|nr:unnamed protein product [Soboliphyme baturini]
MKLKNRIAAQATRDRKKLALCKLEEHLCQLEVENESLEIENAELKKMNKLLHEENQVLKSQLEELRAKQSSEVVCPASVSSQNKAIESAAFINAPLPKEQVLFYWTLIWMISWLGLRAAIAPTSLDLLSRPKASMSKRKRFAVTVVRCLQISNLATSRAESSNGVSQTESCNGDAAVIHDHGYVNSNTYVNVSQSCTAVYVQTETTSSSNMVGANEECLSVEDVDVSGSSPVVPDPVMFDEDSLYKQYADVLEFIQLKENSIGKSLAVTEQENDIVLGVIVIFDFRHRKAQYGRNPAELPQLFSGNM